jgi:hypothetical protein
MLAEGQAATARVDAFGDRLNDFSQALLATHYDFDFGDEQILAMDGRVEGRQVIVGRAPYRVVVIPPETRTLLASSVDLLERFLEAGGKVLGFAPLPEWIEAVPDARLAALWARPGVLVLDGPAALNTALELLLPRRVSLVTPQGQQAARLLYMQRDIDGAQAYFIVNNDRAAGCPVTVSLQSSPSAARRLEEWDPLSGEMRVLAAEQRGEMLCFETYFGPAGSRLYLLTPQAERAPAVAAFEQLEACPPAPAGQIQFIGPACPFTRTDPNILTLDSCEFRLADEDWSAPVEVWRAQDAVRRRLGMRPNYYNGLPQRYRWALKTHPADGASVDLRFSFMVRQVPPAPLFLLLESAERFKISLNGQVVQSTLAGWYLDRAFDKVALPELRPGLNEIVLSCVYTNYMELEDCYLLGDFGVSLGREIIAEPAVLHFGEWPGQGYPHYAGSMIYHGSVEHTEGKRARVFLGEYRAVDVAVHVNGQLAGHIPWRAANGLEITRLLVPGANRVDIEVVSSPRNMLGPLHRAPEHEPWTDWRSFRRTDQTFTPAYVYWPWGLTGQVRVLES